MKTSEGPEDKYHLFWFVALLLGVGVLFPWNAFISALDFFGEQFPNASIEFLLSLAYNYPSIVFLILSVKYGPRFSVTLRTVSGLSLILFALIFTPIVAVYGSHDLGLWLVLLGALLSGMAGAILFSSVASFLALFPGDYLTAFMSGNGVAGVIVGVVRMITKISMSQGRNGVIWSSMIYFAIAAFIVFLCIVAYYWSLGLPFVKYYSKNLESKQKPIMVHPIGDPITKTMSAEVTALLMEEESSFGNSVSIMSVQRKVWLESLEVSTVFFVTLSLFPGMTGQIQPHEKSFNSAWFGILMIFTFQLFDFVGRTLPKWFVIFTPNLLWILVFARYAFFLLFILCIKPKVFANDAFAFTFMVIFALTNGYAGTLAMMFGPSRVLDHEKETAATILSFYLNFGIFLGVHFSILILYLTEGSSSLPFK